MSAPLFIQIRDRVIEELNTDRPSDVPEATSRRSFPEEPVRDEPRIAVFLGDETVDPPRGSSNMDPISRRRLPIAVQCVAGTDDIAEVDDIVAPLIAWVTSVLAQTNLDGLVHYMRETSTQRAPQYMDLYIMRATLIFEVSYQTLRRDITART